MRQRAQIPKYTLFRVFPYRAGVENHNISFAWVTRERKAHIFQHTRQPFAVGDILLTSERVHQRHGMGFPFREIVADEAFKVPLPGQLRFRDMSCRFHASASRRVAKIFAIIPQF